MLVLEEKRMMMFGGLDVLGGEGIEKRRINTEKSERLDGGIKWVGRMGKKSWKIGDEGKKSWRLGWKSRLNGVGTKQATHPTKA